MSRARFAAAALALATTGAAVLFASLVPAQAAALDPTPVPLAAGAEASTTVSSAGGTRTLIVDPTANLADSGATVKVAGAGFDTDHGLYVAVCAGSGGAPDLSKCIGGAIPNGNTTHGWAHITKDGTGPGGVLASWQPNGSFTVTLALPSATAGTVNCVTSKCSLYTTSDDVSIHTEDNSVPVTFVVPTSSSSAPPTVPSTAIAQNIGSPTIVAGGTQSVIFSGFKAGEQVNLTLFSDPITLSPVTADGTGVARVDFIVPADFAVGTHRLEAIGQQSGTVGVASFQVTAPPPTPSPTPTPTPTPTPSSSASSSATSSSSAASSSAAASSAPTSSSTAAPTDSDSGSSLWWLWLILAIVVIAGIVTGIVVYRRNQQQQREQDEQQIADAAAAAQAGGPGQPAPDGPPGTYGSDAPTVFLPPVPPGPGGPPPGADPYGLLSGRDHPDNPSLYSGDPAGPTEVLGPQGYQQGPGPYGQPLGYGGPAQGYGPPPDAPGYVAPQEFGGPAQGGQPTQAMPGVPGAADPADGTGTQSWRPDFDDTDTGAGDGDERAGDGDEEGGGKGGGRR
jgi:hypothetical protein